MKRRMLIASLATAALAVGVIGGSVLAQDSTATSEPSTEAPEASDGLFARAAEILGIGQDELKDAFKQAGQDIRTEQRDAQIDKLVEDGVLTEQEAADLRAWLDNRPEALDKIAPFNGPGFGHGHRGHGRSFAPPVFEFRAPRVEGGILPPDGAFFDQFDALRGEHGFGPLDGKGFRFFWSGPSDSGGEDGAADNGAVTGDGVSA